MATTTVLGGVSGGGSGAGSGGSGLNSSGANNNNSSSNNNSSAQSATGGSRSGSISNSYGYERRRLLSYTAPSPRTAAAFDRLNDGIEFDRGNCCAKFQQSAKRRVRRVWHVSKVASINLLRACGFMVDHIDAIRASQHDDYMELDSDEGGPPEEPASVVFWHNLKLALAIVALICVTALEPVLLKVMADHTMVDELRDYRYVLAQLLMLTHIPLAIGSAIWYACKYSRPALESCDFPKTWFVLLAFLNSLHLIMQVVSSGSVPAPLTILLVNASIPLTKVFGALLTGAMIAIQYWMPNLPEYWLADENSATEPMLQQVQHQLMLEQRNRLQQQQGSGNNGFGSSLRQSGQQGETSNCQSCVRLACKRALLKSKRFIVKRPYAILSMIFVVAGVFLGMFPIITDDVSALGEKSYCHVYNHDCASSTIIFLLSAIPAALSAICEERTLVRYSLPVAPMMLHGWLVPMQFLFGVILAPIGRHLQHPTRKWSNVSMEVRGLDEEVSQGLQCILLGKETGIGYIGHADPDWCKPLLPLLILFLLVSFSYHMLTLFIMRKATELSLRICTALAIPIGWSALVVYDFYFQPNVSKDVPTQVVISPFNKVALACIVISLFFHRTIAEPETSYILTSPFEEQDRMTIEAASERHRRLLLEARSQQQQQQHPDGHHPSNEFM